MSDEVTIQGTTSANRTLADGTLRIQVDVPPNDSDTAYQYIGKPGSLVVMVPLRDSPKAMQQQTVEEGNGAAYETLHRNGFFKRPQVAEAAGSDAEYLEWLKEQRCLLHGQDCGGDIVPAHVRRVSKGSGTAKKPEYSAVPLCDTHHQLQHQKGYSELGGIERLEKQAGRCLSRWVARKIAGEFEKERLREVDPKQFMVWAEANDVDKLLPGEFMEFV